MAGERPENCRCTTPQYTLILNQQGAQGIRGQKGEEGFSPIITVLENTPFSYVLKIQTKDEEIVTPNLRASIPEGHGIGYVLTITDEEGKYDWQPLPIATDEQSGITQYAVLEDTIPDEFGDIEDGKSVTPNLLVEYTKQETDKLDAKLTEELKQSILDTQQALQQEIDKKLDSSVAEETYALKTDVSDLSSKVDTNTSDITQLKEDVQDVVTDLGTKANASELESLQTEVSELQTSVQTNTTEIANINGDLANETAEREEADNVINATLLTKMDDAVLGGLLRIKDAPITRMTNIGNWNLKCSFNTLTNIGSPYFNFNTYEYLETSLGYSANIYNSNPKAYSGSIDFDLSSLDGESTCYFVYGSIEDIGNSSPHIQPLQNIEFDFFLEDLYNPPEHTTRDYKLHCRVWQDANTILRDDTYDLGTSINVPVKFHFEVSNSAGSKSLTLAYRVTVNGTVRINQSNITITTPVTNYNYGYIGAFPTKNIEYPEGFVGICNIDLESISVVDGDNSTKFLTDREPKDLLLNGITDMRGELLQFSSQEGNESNPYPTIFESLWVPYATIDGKVGDRYIVNAGTVAPDNKTIKLGGYGGAISVNTDVIQEKLIAGENITIDPETNTISASGGTGDVTHQEFDALEQRVTNLETVIDGGNAEGKVPINVYEQINPVDESPRGFSEDIEIKDGGNS